MDGKIYADYNATTPLAPEVIGAITNSLSNDWANPNSQHFLGKSARDAIEDARSAVARMLDGEPEYVTFTSGGTEANNMVISGICKNTSVEGIPHVITSAVEHDSIILPIRHLQEAGVVTVTEVPVSQSGLSAQDVISAITDQTVLVTIMAANNETGLIMPIREIGQTLQKLNVERLGKNLPRIVYHSDGAQIIGKVPVSVKHLCLDCFTIVGHKFYGPRIGALWSRVEIPPLLFGGGQERNRRAGTENTPMIVGLGAAAQLVADHLNVYSSVMEKSRERFEKLLRDPKLTDVRFRELVTINCEHLPRLPNTTSLSMKHDYTGRQVLNQCRRVLAGVGAACHSSSQGSPILIRHGISAQLAASAIRISFGRDITEDTIIDIVEDLQSAALHLHNKQVDSL